MTLVVQSITVAECSAMIERVQSGCASAETLRAFLLSAVDQVESLKSELGRRTLQELAPRGHGSDTKRQVVQRIVHQLLAGLIPGDSLQWSPMEETFKQAIRRTANSITDQMIQDIQARRQATRDAEHQMRTDPQSMADFRRNVSVHGGTEHLSLEQLRRWDQMEADVSRGKRQQAAASRVVEKFSAGASGVSLSLKQGWHDKRQADLWIVQVHERVPREQYQEMLSKAKQLGGWYSSFKKSDAGFQFLSRESAEKFVALCMGDADRAEELSQRASRREQTAGERLLELADRVEAEADSILHAERQVNTVRRARMAASMEGAARQQIGLARLIRNIAETLCDESAVYLNGVRYRTDVEELLGSLAGGRYQRRQDASKHAKLSGHSSYQRTLLEEQIRREPWSEEDIRHVKYPRPEVYWQHIFEMGCHLKGGKGTVKIGSRLVKIAEINSGEYVRFESVMQIEELLLAYGKAKGTGWRCDPLEAALDEWKRFQRMGIGTVHELRMALRELLPLVGSVDQADPVLTMERELIGVPIPGFFATPDDIARQVIELADIRDGMTVLEPSAGKGDLADAVREVADVALTCIEIDSRLRGILEAKGHDMAARHDFLDRTGPVATGFYDRIVMNPPFEGGQDMDHVRLAYECLAPSGRLVAIMSEGTFFRGDKKATEFRAWLDQVGGTSERLPEDAFSRENAFRKTKVQTRVVVIDKGEVR